MHYMNVSPSSNHSTAALLYALEKDWCICLGSHMPPPQLETKRLTSASHYSFIGRHDDDSL